MSNHPIYVDILDDLQDNFDHGYARESLEAAFAAGRRAERGHKATVERPLHVPRADAMSDRLAEIRARLGLPETDPGDSQNERDTIWLVAEVQRLRQVNQ